MTKQNVTLRLHALDWRDLLRSIQAIDDGDQRGKYKEMQTFFIEKMNIQGERIGRRAKLVDKL